ncbi:MAG: NnrU family protein [Roseovarius confluentis]
MTLLILGLILWTVAHLFKRVAPGPRAALQDRMGDASKAVFAVVLLISVVLMVMGYRGADTTFYWGRSPATTGINNLLMLIAVALYGVGNSKSRLREKMRHPMLWGTVIWAVSHILVNGDSVSLVLFGWIAVWALVEMAMINRAVTDYAPWSGGSVAGDIRLAVIAIVLYAIIAGIHTWLGYYPFGG